MSNPVLKLEEEDYSKSVTNIKNQDFLKHINKFEGSKDGLPTLIVKNEMKSSRWNFSLIVPLMPDEVVFIHPDQSGVDVNFVKIIHSDHNAVATFHKNHFIDPTMPVLESANDAATELYIEVNDDIIKTDQEIDK